MKLRRLTVQRQVVARMIGGERRDFVIAEWPEGTHLPEHVLHMIMETWTDDDSWVDKDGSILYVRERRQRGGAFKVETYPLILVDETNEVLYGADALKAGVRSGVQSVKVVRIVAEDYGLPPKGQRHHTN
jgi:hypothetical protein